MIADNRVPHPEHRAVGPAYIPIHKTHSTWEIFLDVLIFPIGIGRLPGILAATQQVGTSLGLVPHLLWLGLLVPVLPPIV